MRIIVGTLRSKLCVFEHARLQNLPSLNLTNNKELLDNASKYCGISSYGILYIIFYYFQADFSVSDLAAQLRSWSILTEFVKINFCLTNGIKTKAIVLEDLTPFSIQDRFYCYRVQHMYSVTGM